VSGSGEPGFMPSSSKDEMAPRLVSSRPWLDERRTKVRRDESDARPPVPAPCVNVARRSRDGARVDSPSARDPLDEKRLEERAPACVPVDTTRTRERVNATTYRCRSGITTVGPLQEGSTLERACHTSQEDPGESVETPRIGETRTFHDVRSRSDLGRIRSISRAKSRREAEGAVTGVSEVERERWGAREDNARLLPSSIPRSAHGVVKHRPHRSLVVCVRSWRQ
jgi:hypothetical protein